MCWAIKWKIKYDRAIKWSVKVKELKQFDEQIKPTNIQVSGRVYQKWKHGKSGIGASLQILKLKTEIKNVAWATNWNKSD